MSQEKVINGFAVEIKTKEGDSWLWQRVHSSKRAALHEGFVGWKEWIKEQSGYDNVEDAWRDTSVRARLLQKMRRGRGPNGFRVRVVRARMMKL